MSFLGMWTDQVDEAGIFELQAYGCEWLTLGWGAWSSAPTLIQRLPSLKAASYRETRGPGAKLRGFMSAWDLAEEQADFFDHLVKIGAYTQAQAKERCYGHCLDEEHTDFEWAIVYEEVWIRRLHQRGYRGIGWNCSFGWDYSRLSETQRIRLQAHWRNLDLIGRHSYIGWLFNANPPREASLEDTALAPLGWEGFPVEKWLATEGGFDFWSTGQGDGGYQGEGSPGWAVTGLNEVQVANRLMEVCTRMIIRGAAGYTVFCHRAQNEAQWRNFYATPKMLNTWKSFQSIRLPQGEAMPITKEDLEKARLAIREEFLNVQKALDAGKKNVSYEEMGKEIDGVFAIAGKGANATDAQFAELLKKL